MEAVQSSGEAKLPKYDCLLFDLDDTLYPLSTGVQAACRMNIEDYMVEVLKIDKSEVSSMCADLHKSHGTTMARLKALGYEIDNDDFHSFVHGRLPYENLRPDPVPRSLLLSMPQRKIPKWNDALLEVFRIDFFGTAPYITCTPTLRHHRLGPEDHYLILSSDGLYQYFTNEEVVNHVEWFMSSYPDGDPAQQLVEEVLFRAAKKAGMDFHELLDIPQGDRRKYHDDVSVMVISLEGRIWRSQV